MLNAAVVLQVVNISAVQIAVFVIVAVAVDTTNVVQVVVRWGHRLRQNRLVIAAVGLMGPVGTRRTAAIMKRGYRLEAVIITVIQKAGVLLT
jgi:hypothetical protein